MKIKELLTIYERSAEMLAAELEKFNPKLKLDQYSARSKAQQFDEDLLEGWLTLLVFYRLLENHGNNMPELSKKLRAFLAQRWEAIKNTNLEYTQVAFESDGQVCFESVGNTLCFKLSEYLYRHLSEEEKKKTSPLQLLMPTVKQHQPKQGEKLTHYIISDDRARLIHVYDALSGFEYKNLKELRDLKIKDPSVLNEGQPRFLSDIEKLKILTHSDITQAFKKVVNTVVGYFAHVGDNGQGKQQIEGVIAVNDTQAYLKFKNDNKNEDGKEPSIVEYMQSQLLSASKTAHKKFKDYKNQQKLPLYMKGKLESGHDTLVENCTNRLAHFIEKKMLDKRLLKALPGSDYLNVRCMQLLEKNENAQQAFLKLGVQKTPKKPEGGVEVPVLDNSDSNGEEEITKLFSEVQLQEQKHVSAPGKLSGQTGVEGLPPPIPPVQVSSEKEKGDASTQESDSLQTSYESDSEEISSVDSDGGSEEIDGESEGSEEHVSETEVKEGESGTNGQKLPEDSVEPTPSFTDESTLPPLPSPVSVPVIKPDALGQDSFNTPWMQIKLPAFTPAGKLVLPNAFESPKSTMKRYGLTMKNLGLDSPANRPDPSSPYQLPGSPLVSRFNLDSGGNRFVMPSPIKLTYSPAKSCDNLSSEQPLQTGPNTTETDSQESTKALTQRSDQTSSGSTTDTTTSKSDQKTPVKTKDKHSKKRVQAPQNKTKWYSTPLRTLDFLVSFAWLFGVNAIVSVFYELLHATGQLHAYNVKLFRGTANRLPRVAQIFLTIPHTLARILLLPFQVVLNTILEMGVLSVFAAGTAFSKPLSTKTIRAASLSKSRWFGLRNKATRGFTFALMYPVMILNSVAENAKGQPVASTDGYYFMAKDVVILAAIVGLLVGVVAAICIASGVGLPVLSAVQSFVLAQTGLDIIIPSLSLAVNALGLASMAGFVGTLLAEGAVAVFAWTTWAIGYGVQAIMNRVSLDSNDPLRTQDQEWERSYRRLPGDERPKQYDSNSGILPERFSALFDTRFEARAQVVRDESTMSPIIKT